MGILSDVVIEPITNKVGSRISSLLTMPIFGSWINVFAATKQVGKSIVITTSSTSSVRLLNVSLSSFGSDDVRFSN